MQDRMSVCRRSTEHKPYMKFDLSQPRKRLVECFQELRYGRVKDLVKHDSEPEWSPPPRAVHDVIIGKRQCSHPKRQSANFALKDHVENFFWHFDRAPEGTRFTVFVEDGLPVRFLMEKPNRS